MADLSRRRFLRSAVLAGGGLVAATVAACAPGASAPGLDVRTDRRHRRTPSPTHRTGRHARCLDGPRRRPVRQPVGQSRHGRRTTRTRRRSSSASSTASRRRSKAPATSPTASRGSTANARSSSSRSTRSSTGSTPSRSRSTRSASTARGPGRGSTSSRATRVRAIFTNNLDESTGIHFHGQRLPNAMDGVPHITQDPIEPGASFTYEFTARTVGSHMYHSHHNATDQVGRGLLGAFIVHPRDAAERVRAQVRREPGHRLDQQRLARRVHDQRPRLPGDGADRRQARRQDPHPVHERGRDDASLASPRDADARRRPRRLRRSGRPRSRATRSGVNPGERWDVVDRLRRARRVGVPLPHPPPRRGPGRACSGWSPRWSSRTATVRGRRPRPRPSRSAAAAAAGSTAWMCLVG